MQTAWLGWGTARCSSACSERGHLARARPLGGASKLFCMRGRGRNLMTGVELRTAQRGGVHLGPVPTPSQRDGGALLAGTGRHSTEGRASPRLALQEHAFRTWAEVDSMKNLPFSPL